MHAWCTCGHTEHWHKSGPCTWIFESFGQLEDGTYGTVRIRACETACAAFDLGSVV